MNHADERPLDDAAWCDRALRSEPLPDDVAALVTAALVHARAREARGSAALAGAVLALAAGAAFAAAPSAGEIAAALVDAAWWAVAVDHAVQALVPGRWTTLAFVGLGLAAASVSSLARALPGARAAVAGAAAAALALAAWAGPAHALELEGEWPEDERVTVAVEDTAAADALREVLRAAGLGLVSSWSDPRLVDVDVENAPLREVVRGLVGDADVVVRRVGTVVTVEPRRPVAAGGAAAARELQREAQPAPAAPAPPPAPVTAEDLQDARDRVTFGDDVTIGRYERVRDVVTLGGDVEIFGHALNVVTLGGDLRVREGGVVHGDVVTAGGEVVVEDGGRVLQRGMQFGRGGVAVDGHGGHGRRAAREAGWPGLGVLERVLRGAAHAALFFLMGLLLVYVAPDRVRRAQSAIARAPVRTGAVGVGVLLAGVAAAFVLFVTILGIPLAFALLLALVVLGYAGAAVTASVLGAALPVPRLHERPLAQLGAGVAILFVVSLVPVLDVLVLLGTVATGLGAFLVTRFGAVSDGGGARPSGR